MTISPKQDQRSRKSLPHLLEQLQAKSVSARVSALELLAKHHDPLVFSATVKALSDRSPRVRVTAVENLGLLNDKRSAPHLVTSLKDSNPEVRMRAAENLGVLLQNEPSPGALISCLRDPDKLVRITVAESLGAIGDRRALPSLWKTIYDASPLVRSYVAAAIGELGDNRDLSKLKKRIGEEKSETAKVGFYHALHLLGEPDILRDLLGLLKSKDYRVRCATANTLSAIHVDDSDKKLITRTLRKALKQEPTIAGRDSLRSSLRRLDK